MEQASPIGLVLLAAGASTRLGQPKQQLLYKGKSLLQHALQTIQQSAVNNVAVVLGAGASEIRNAHAFGTAHVVENPDWQEGMASSISTGLNSLLKAAPNAGGVIFMVCDQPFVTATLLDQLISTYSQTNKEIIACSYQETLGTPVLFRKKFFPDLLALQGQEGAKKLIKKFPEAVMAVAFPKGSIDIDTPQDYENLQKGDSE
ncbi:nucleotidyltransferase family protein [Adhaeribacter aquaticus]|uniref:nucleotidyltransferase family protein n=1 Tax=Adhaeribacter aquaticus TaxID=299567 RepID=UPI00041FBA88|nr:nucleotidyltransferase family protein [Adhaeribacter aquaticus]